MDHVPAHDERRVTLHFIGGPPSDDAYYFARRCAHHYVIAEPIELILEWQPGGKMLRSLTLQSEQRVQLIEREPDPLLAIRNILSRFRDRRGKPTRELSALRLSAGLDLSLAGTERRLTP